MPRTSHPVLSPGQAAGTAPMRASSSRLVTAKGLGERKMAESYNIWACSSAACRWAVSYSVP